MCQQQTTTMLVGEVERGDQRKEEDEWREVKGSRHWSNATP